MVRAMTVRRLVSILSVVLASSSIAVAQPKPAPAKKPAPGDGTAKQPAPPPTTSAPAAGDPAAPPPGGDAVTPPEDAPPADMDGTAENPDAPRGTTSETTQIVVPAKQARAGYPIEEALRPITLPQNMSEVSIGPHAQVKPWQGSDALRARYGITRQIQLGLSYLMLATFDDPKTARNKIGVHAGKAVGLDVTVLVQNWVGVRVGVPVYIDPVAVSLALGAPMKFILTDRFAIGGFDDLLNIRIKRFAPTFYQEEMNAHNASDEAINTIVSRGSLRFSAYGVYQQSPKLAIIGRLGLTMEDFAVNRTDAGGSGLTSFLRAGFQYSVRRSIDLGLSIGFDDLAEPGTFGPAGLLAFRI